MMNAEIKCRIEQVRRGEVPDGYIDKHGYCFPIGWHIGKLRDGFTRLTKKNAEKCKNVLTISAQQGLISQKEYYNHSYASENTQGYSLLAKGDYAYNKSYSEGYPFGAIKRLEKYNKGIVSPLYICFSSNTDRNSDYYSHYFEAGVFNRGIYLIAQEGARNHGLLNVAVEDFFDGYILCPSIAEQQKIAEILAQCDKVIALKQELLDEKRKQKKWLMKKLLNPGAKDKNNIEWQYCRMKDICTVFSGGTPKSTQAKYYSTFEISFIRSGEIDKDQTELYISNDGIKNSSAKMIGEGDLLYALYGANSGDCAIAKISGAINQAILCIRSHSVEPLFLYYVLSSMKETIVSTYLQGGQGNLSAEIIKKLRISIPKDSRARTKIITLLSTVDKEIDLMQQELAAWKEKKKGLAQRLLTGLVRV